MLFPIGHKKLLGGWKIFTLNIFKRQNVYYKVIGTKNMHFNHIIEYWSLSLLIFWFLPNNLYLWTILTKLFFVFSCCFWSKWTSGIFNVINLWKMFCEFRQRVLSLFENFLMSFFLKTKYSCHTGFNNKKLRLILMLLSIIVDKCYIWNLT